MASTPIAENINEKSYGGLFARLCAYIVDCIILFAGLLVLQATLYFVNPLAPFISSGQPPPGGLLHLWVFATATLPFLFYFALMQSSARQATIGMRRLNLKVTNINDGRVGFWRALLRSAVMLIPFELNHAVMFHLSPRNAAPSPEFWLGCAGVWILIAAYIGLILITRRHQSLHDLAASTVVRRLDRRLFASAVSILVNQLQLYK